ncbi:regulator [Streptococcus dysgalactiae]|uniref:regulator n=1 Tax=Streptococcus dysgalactiae TaxID=1334 RepID=UPI000E078592|nr:regulator [Streptococcus dysgalactiae]MCB2833550.1 regulator [Streptococcus dysgalactiae subsp. dysgalactiae]MCB2841310.1 regulator [Streptococcus dysgalactiae subsp. dysgalactiae]MCB2845131.1 regulator [Streptococcus dysgalactiae subsp. dysgalactiae]QQT03731.1 regulator [Streptococcus dysgalactiae]SUN47001.1 two-component response regulator histidine kinase [Streptococcus dysgalactiae subsp. dysgalactiae]
MIIEFLQFLSFIFLDIIEIMLLLTLFSRISTISVPLKRIFYLSLGIITVETIFLTFYTDNLNIDVISVGRLIFFLGIAFYYGKSRTNLLLLFYALFTFIAPNLFLRFITLFVIPLLKLTSDKAAANYFLVYGLVYIGIFLTYAMIKLLRYNFNHWKTKLQSLGYRCLLVMTTLSMLAYYSLLDISYIGVTSQTLKQRIVLGYLFLLFVLVTILDRWAKRTVTKNALFKDD